MTIREAYNKLKFKYHAFGHKPVMIDQVDLPAGEWVNFGVLPNDEARKIEVFDTDTFEIVYKSNSDKIEWFPPHKHPNQETVFVLSGMCEIYTPTNDVKTLRVGESWSIAKGVPHIFKIWPKTSLRLIWFPRFESQNWEAKYENPEK